MIRHSFVRTNKAHRTLLSSGSKCCYHSVYFGLIESQQSFITDAKDIESQVDSLI